MKPTTELLHQLKSAAQEEIMCREASDTSDAWQDLASPENILALIEIALPVLEAETDAEKYGVGFVVCQSGQKPKRADPTKVTISFTDSGLGYAQPQTSTTPQIDNDVWIEWGGGDCPLPVGCKVEIRTRIGGLRRDLPAHRWGWEHLNDFDDIIAYRVIGGEPCQS